MNKVYGVSLSQYVRKVLLVLEHKQVDYELEMTIPRMTPEGYEKISPLKKVPAFEDEYTCLAESGVICQYIEEKYPDVSIWPSAREDRAKARFIERYCDTELGRTLAGGYFFQKLICPAMMGQASDEAIIEQTLTQDLPPILTYLESQVPSAGFMFADGIGLADFTMGSFFLNATYCGYKLDAGSYPKLAAYIARLLSHDLFEKRKADDKPLVDNLLSKL